ncbi:MAG: DUF4153 domain-containing protein [Vicingaceae bacterium]|nr:DUF4153 domain-containing protein [Vicingaceae bacterium]
MKLPSIQYLQEKTVTALKRFPLSILAATIGVICAIYLIEHEHYQGNLFPVINLMLCAALGIPLFFCVTVFSEKLTFSFKIKALLSLIGTLILVGIYFSLPNSDESFNTSLPYVRYAIYNITIHLLVAFAPFILKKEINGFWQYNKVLFIRFLTSVLYSGFLYVGIVLALVSLKLLFDVNIRDQFYFEFWVIIAGLFNTWFFTAGMPTSLTNLDNDYEYPTGLKIFSQYILLPLLMLYLLILYGYGIKIFAAWDWPKGIVSYLIVCVAILGILNFLLIYPYSKQKENKWIATFSRVYYFILFPLIIMLFIAINMRIGDYGITINRYIILLLGCWLTLVAIYFAIGKANIKFIPISLFTVILLTSFGPWGMFSVSENSQVNRLKNLLETHQLLENNSITNEQTIDLVSSYYNHEFTPKNEKLFPDSIKNDIKSILDYLNDHHGLTKIKPWFSNNYDAEIASFNQDKRKYERVNEANIYMNALGLAYTHHYTNNNQIYFSFSAENKHNKVLDISGYDYQVKVNSNYNNNVVLQTFVINNKEYELKIQDNENMLLLLENKQLKSALNFNEIIKKLMDNYKNSNNNYDIPVNEMTIVSETEGVKLKFIFDNINIETDKKTLKPSYFNGILLLKLFKVQI